MPGKMLSQTKRTIDALLSCGFSRSEFSAQTKYDETEGYFKPTRVRFNTHPAQRKALELSQKLADTGVLDVTIFISEDKNLSWATVEEGKGNLLKIDLDENNRLRSNK